MHFFKIESPEELIKFFGVSGEFVKKLTTFKERLSVESLPK
jgi:hypothetical protein